MGRSSTQTSRSMAIPRRKTVQIVGAAPSMMTDPVLEGAERWLFNASYLTDLGRPHTRVFHLHAPAMILGLQPKVWAWLQQQDKPVYLLEPHEDIPTSVRFPLEELQQYFANETRDGPLKPESCFGCTVDFLIALALMEGFEVIDLMGIECRSEDEYRDQARSVMYWMGRGRGMGRVVTCSDTSGLCMVPAIYGYNIPTGSPTPPGQPKQWWAAGHRHSTWPAPAGVPGDAILVNGAYEHP